MLPGITDQAIRGCSLTMWHLRLRPATADDLPFLYRLHRASMRKHVERTYGKWEEAWQHGHFRQSFRVEGCWLVCIEDLDVGAVYLLERQSEVSVNRMEILPGFQGKGIGSQVLQFVLSEAHSCGKVMKLQVLKGNPARRLYERLGFHTVGETDTHYRMESVPPESS